MHFVDQVDLEAAFARCVLNVFEKLAGVLYLGTAGGVDFDQINKPPCFDRLAGATGQTWRRGHAGFTVQTAGKNSGNAGLANTTGADKKVCMMESIIGQRVGQRLGHMVLSDQLLKVTWTVFPGQYLRQNTLA